MWDEIGDRTDGIVPDYGFMQLECEPASVQSSATVDLLPESRRALRN